MSWFSLTMLLSQLIVANDHKAFLLSSTSSIDLEKSPTDRSTPPADETLANDAQVKPAGAVLSLFSGAGGMDLGFTWAGFRPALCVEHDHAAAETLSFIVGKNSVARIDIEQTTGSALSELLPNDVRIRGVIGGPPCQGFSKGNVTKRRRDPRNSLPLHYARLLGELKDTHDLDFFVFENVMGLLHKRHANRFRQIKTAFRKQGFHLRIFEINSADYGVPQVRHRLFIVGFRDPVAALHFELPASDQVCRTVGEALLGLPEPTFYRRGLTAREIPYHPNHWTMQPKSVRFETQEFNDYRSFRRLKWNEPSPTVAYGNREIHVHPNGTRRLSILEAMLLQGFPKKIQLRGTLSEQVTQVSNAVPPPVAREVAAAIRTQVTHQPSETKR